MQLSTAYLALVNRALADRWEPSTIPCPPPVDDRRTDRECWLHDLVALRNYRRARRESLRKTDPVPAADLAPLSTRDARRAYRKISRPGWLFSVSDA